MQKPTGRHVPRPTSAPRPGKVTRAKGRTLDSCRIGALPIIDRILQRMRLEEFLRSYLPRADRRCRIAPAIGVTLLLKNVLLCREPLYYSVNFSCGFSRMSDVNLREPLVFQGFRKGSSGVPGGWCWVVRRKLLFSNDLWRKAGYSVYRTQVTEIK